MKLWKSLVAAGLTAAGVASSADAQVVVGPVGAPAGYGAYVPYGGGGVTFGMPGVGTVTTNGVSGYATPGYGATSYSYPAVSGYTGNTYYPGGTGYYTNTQGYTAPNTSYYPTTYAAGYSPSGFSYPGFSTAAAPAAGVTQSGFLSFGPTAGFGSPSYPAGLYGYGYTPGSSTSRYGAAAPAGAGRRGFRVFR